jgi:DNA-binding transcriptional MerR regulator
MDMNDELMDTSEVARLCHTVPATVRYWRHQGTGPLGFRVGRRVLYRRSTVMEWIGEREAADQGRTLTRPPAIR